MLEQSTTAEHSLFTLTELLHSVNQAIDCYLPETPWVKAEINHIRHKQTRYKRPFYQIELVEVVQGRNQAQAQAKIWPKNISIVHNFEQVTGTQLTHNLTILAQVKLEVHPLYGLQLEIIDIDPRYTLGVIEAQKQAIRDQLTAEGIINHNQQRPQPKDFTHVAVISPSQAAGLGDFKTSSSILESHQVCQFSYYTATFQSREAPDSIRQAIRSILSATPQPDAIILIRGGGAASDLHWLNELKLAREICLCPIPVMTGIGHAQDSTVLDEVAHTACHTPSKVIEYIRTTIQHQALQADQHWQNVCHRAQNTIAYKHNQIDHLRQRVQQSIVALLDQKCQAVKYYQSHIKRQLSHHVQLSAQHCHNYTQMIVQQGQRLIQDRQIHCRQHLRLIRNQARQLPTHYAHHADRRWQYIQHYCHRTTERYQSKVANYLQTLHQRARYQIQQQQWRVSQYSQLVQQKAQNLTQQWRQHYHHQYHTIAQNARYQQCQFAERFAHLKALIESHSPQKTLQKGFTMVQNHTGYAKSAYELNIDDQINIHFHDGQVPATVIHPEEFND